MMDMADNTWTYESRVTAPSGLRVVVTIEVPPNAAWTPKHEAGEIADMASKHALKLIAAGQDRPPF